MTRRSHGSGISLRDGCFPAAGYQHPPHNYRRQPDGITVTLVTEDQYDSLPVFKDIYSEPKWQSGFTLYQVRTPNGWCCYMVSFQAVRDLLELAAAGRDGVLLWMRGETPEAAATRAREIWQQEQEECQRRRETSPSPPSIDLDLDIDI